MRRDDQTIGVYEVERCVVIEQLYLLIQMLKAYWDILLKACHTLPLTYSQASLVRRRAAGIKALYFWEEGKVQLYNCQFDKAREFISEANHVLRMPKLELVLLGLKVAPRTTRSLALYWTQL